MLSHDPTLFWLYLSVILGRIQMHLAWSSFHRLSNFLCAWHQFSASCGCNITLETFSYRNASQSVGTKSACTRNQDIKLQDLLHMLYPTFSLSKATLPPLYSPQIFNLLIENSFCARSKNYMIQTTLVSKSFSTSSSNC